VCFITGVLGRGGAERQLVYALRALAPHPIEARVLALTYGEPMQKEIEGLGIRVEWIGGHPSPVRRLQTIISALRAEPADVIQSVHCYTNIYAAIAANLTQTTSLGAVRGDGREELRSTSIFRPAALYLPHYLLVNSAPARQFALRQGRSPERVILLRNAIDIDHFGKGKGGRCRPNSDRLHLLFVGRLSEEKRADRFLRLVAATGSHLGGRRIEARIAGDGPDRVSLEALRTSLGLNSSQVQFLGQLSDTAPLYSWADMLVLTSDHEGTPNVILEAMAAGIPVVATAVGGVPDLLCRGGGLLVRPNQEDDLTRAVLALATNHHLKDHLVREASRYIAHNHSLPGLATQLMGIYRAAVGRRPAVQ
jgi:glycosyltransferase involved in cell wall biosynthesis